MNFRSETQGTVAPGETFAELGTVVFQGQEFSSQGAYIADDRLVAYLGIPIGVKSAEYPRTHGRVQTWNGRDIGRYIIVKSWRVRTCYDWYEMHQVSIRLEDGRQYQGRSQGPGMIVKARRIAAQRRQKVDRPNAQTSDRS